MWKIEQFILISALLRCAVVRNATVLTREQGENRIYAQRTYYKLVMCLVLVLKEKSHGTLAHMP